MLRLMGGGGRSIIGLRGILGICFLWGGVYWVVIRFNF